MNAETSAWGRAIVAALAADTQKIASAQEVRNRQAEQQYPEAPPRVVNNTVNRDTLPNPRPRPAAESTERPSEAPESPAEEPKPQRAKVGSAAAPTTLSDAQRGKIRAMWRSLEADGNAPGDNPVAWCAELVGREITVINELTKKEASQVIEELIRRQA